MKLKLKGDGTTNGTSIFSEHNEQLIGVKNFNWRISGQKTFLELEVENAEFEVGPNIKWNGCNPKVSNGFFRLKVVGCMSSLGNNLIVVDADSNDLIEDINYMTWKVNRTKVGTAGPIGLAELSLEIRDPAVELSSKPIVTFSQMNLFSNNGHGNTGHTGIPGPVGVPGPVGGPIPTGIPTNKPHVVLGTSAGKSNASVGGYNPCISVDDPLFDFLNAMDKACSCPKSKDGNHQWVNAGFTSIKMVCKHCNADKIS